MIKSLVLSSQDSKIKNKNNIRVSSSFNFLENLSDTDLDFPHDAQVEMITKLYNNIPFTYENEIAKDIKRKHLSYIQQDKLKRVYDFNVGISYEQTLEKLFLSGLKCHYCDCNLSIIYKYKRLPEQWSLDRIYNEQGHSFDNVLVSCLRCNLSRRCQNSEKFLFTKKLKVIKT